MISCLIFNRAAAMVYPHISNAHLKDHTIDNYLKMVVYLTLLYGLSRGGRVYECIHPNCKKHLQESTKVEAE
jgi:hypothetical protein